MQIQNKCFPHTHTHTHEEENRREREREREGGEGKKKKATTQDKKDPMPGRRVTTSATKERNKKR